MWTGILDGLLICGVAGLVIALAALLGWSWDFDWLDLL